jgi:NitT/TauT family transport system ATP-binding protein
MAMPVLPNQTLLSAEHITKTFPNPEGQGVFKVLDDVSLEVRSGEVVALLGRSGSGKSTLLRILAGLILPNSGVVRTVRGVLTGPNPDIAMVFQSFALLPWATVLENVELGLTARGVPVAERRERALKLIDLVGLDGFESAYPKELSGGMQQRVGFARAFVLQPQVLFLDEPFSALDVLTAENLRGEIGDLWLAGTFPAKSMLIVTHNIDEAVLLADRIIILGTNPGIIRGEVVTNLNRPRDRNLADFKAQVDYIYTIMTNPQMVVTEGPKAEVKAPASRFAPLPHARAGGISGLLELLVERGGREDIPRLAQSLNLDTDDLLQIMDAAALLGFARVSQGDVEVTIIGRNFAETDILHSKEIFRDQILAHAPLVKTIHDSLMEKENHSLPGDFFLDILDEYYPNDEARRQLETAIDWGRFAELYEYAATEDRIYIPVEEQTK